MPIEIEKKYRLSEKQRRDVQQRLSEIGAIFEGDEFEENTLYSGDRLDAATSVLRLRRVGDGAILTFKRRLSGVSSIKQQQEDETPVVDAEAMAAILGALGFVPALVYEKRRATWRLGDARSLSMNCLSASSWRSKAPRPKSGEQKPHSLSKV